MDDVWFNIPLNIEDLASNQQDGYYVEKIYDPNQIDKKLEGWLSLSVL